MPTLTEIHRKASRRRRRDLGRITLAACLVAISSLSCQPSPTHQDDFELVEVPFDDPELGLATGRKVVPSRGELSALVVFAQFKDELDQGEAPPRFAGDLFAPDSPGSFTHFYDTMSFGQLQVRGRALSRYYTSDREARFYRSKRAGRVGRYSEFAQEILQQVDADEDLGLFDNDGPDGVPNSGDDDGVVDYLFILMRSRSQGFIRDGATGKVGLGFDVDFHSQDDVSAAGEPIRVSGRWAHGAIMWQGHNFAQAVGSMAHEFGHSLGLPDLYDLAYSEPAEDSAGIGRWGLMGWGTNGWHGDDGPNPLCAWSREQLGWLGPDNRQLVEVWGDTTDLVIAPLHQGGSIGKIRFNGYRNNEEYLLLEQRVPVGPYDRNLPAPGLLIWHVRPAQEKVGQNNLEARKLVDLVCADGLYGDAGFPLGDVSDARGGHDNLDFWAHEAEYAEAHGGNEGDATDPFDGNRYTRFDLHSNPSSRLVAGQSAESGGLAIVPIRRRGDATVVDIGQSRWSGRIDGQVHWWGGVIVDGDLTVGPQGELVVHTPARVRFAPRDRLDGGLDPGRCELHVQGKIRISRHWVARRDIEPQPAVFESLEPGASWYGIVFAEGSSRQLPEDGYVLRDAEHGLIDFDQMAALAEHAPTAVDEQPVAEAADFALGPSYPNPFAEQTTLPYSLATDAPVHLAVLNVLGQTARVLVDEYQSEGDHEVVWNGQDEAGREVADGVYLSRLVVPGKNPVTGRMLRLRGGTSSIADLDSVLLARQMDWSPFSKELTRIPAPDLALAAAPTPGQAGFTLGLLWVNLRVAGQYREDVPARQGHLRWAAAVVPYLEPSPEQRHSIEEVFRRLGESPVSREQRLQLLSSLRHELESLVQRDDSFSYFYLGEWLQTLRAGALAARRLSVPLAEMADPTRNAAAARQFELRLRDLSAEPALLGALHDLAAALDAAPDTAAEVEAVLALLERIGHPMVVR